MARFKLTPYKIHLKTAKESYLDLTSVNFGSKGKKPFFEIFKEFCEKYTKDVYISTGTHQKTLCIKELDNSVQSSLVNGFIKSGEYGLGADFYNLKSHVHKNRARTPDDSEELPFLFLFCSPLNKNYDTAFLILQKFKQFGAKNILKNAFQNFLSKHNNNLTLEIDPIVSQELIKKLEKSNRLVEVRMIKRKIPKDVADKNLIKNYGDLHEEHVFKARKNKSIILKVKEAIEKNLKNIDYPYSEIQGEKYDEIKLTTEQNGSVSTLTIPLEDQLKIRETMPLIEEELDFKDGFPTKASLLKKAKGYLNTILVSQDENAIGE